MISVVASLFNSYGNILLLDITPSASSSRIVIILLILITVAVIPSLISDLLDTMQKRDGKSRSMSCYYTYMTNPPILVTGGQIIKDADPFILIVGTFTVQQAKEMLDGFLNTVSGLWLGLAKIP